MTARQTPSRVGPWANLILCGGLSWGVNVWHAMNISGGAHWRWLLAMMFGTAPVVVAAIQSHHMAKNSAGTKKRLLTYAVFAMGMALSINAQATAVAPYAPDYYLNWVFPIMLDLSAFMALHSLMTGDQSAPQTSPGERQTERPDSTSQTHQTLSGGRPAVPNQTTLPTSSQTVSAPPAQTTQTAAATPRPDSNQTAPKAAVQTPSDRPAKPAQTARRKPAKAAPEPVAKLVPIDRGKMRELLADNPEMTAADLARALGRDNTGTLRTARTQILAELSAGRTAVSQ